MASEGCHAACQGLHVVALDKDALRRIGPGPDTALCIVLCTPLAGIGKCPT